MTNTGVNVSDFNRWRDCLGQCMICGQPLGLKSNIVAPKKEVSTLEEDDVFLDDPMERLLLTKECPIKTCLTRFNMLGERQNCHIIDQYTFLNQEKKNSSFEEKLIRHKAELESIDQLFEPFIQQILENKNNILGQAQAMCERVGNSHLFSGCRRCNLTMNSPNIHINVLYRYFYLTRSKDIATLEKNTQASIKIKKIIQQIAFYFILNKKTNEWVVKDDFEILKDVNIWRCISSLASWGLTGKFRYKLVAVFHASYYMYMTNSSYSVMTFEDWHIFIFRRLYMNHDFQRGDSWFGMRIDEVKLHFDLSKKRGEEWYSIVKSILDDFNASIELFQQRVDMNKIKTYKDSIMKMVRDEKGLLIFTIQKTQAMGNVERGIEKYLSFFKFNIQHVSPRDLLRDCKLFEKELAREYRKLRSGKGIVAMSSTDQTEE